jgi:PKD repeat protein
VSAINASKVIVGTTSSSAMQALQLAPDGKLYVARNGSGYLAVVSDPDALGTACNFSDNGFYLAGANSAYGLSAFAQDIFSPLTSPQGNFSATDTTICEKFCIDFFDQSLNNPISWQWEFPGASPSSSSVQNPSNICYPFPGVYDVTLITTNSTGNDTVTFDDYMTVYSPPTAPVITQNNNVLTSSIATTYQWQFDGFDIAGATSQSYTAQQTGLYSVIVSDEHGCTNAASLYLVIDGIDVTNGNTYFFIKPNPSAGIFTLQWFYNSSNILPGSSFTINITSASGVIIFSSEEKFSGDHFEKQINLQEHTPGIYLLEIRSGAGIIRKKIIIGR